MAGSDDDAPTRRARQPRSPAGAITPARTVRSSALGSGAQSGSSSTANTSRVQDTGLGPSNLDPSADVASDPNSAPSPFVEVGASGLAQYGGFIREEFLPQLQGDRGLRVYREMYDNDPIVGALVFTIQMLLRKVEWRVEPPVAATVEGIAAARQRERMQMMAQRRQEQAMQQAQLAQGSGPSGASGMQPDGSGGSAFPSQPTPDFASSAFHDQPSAFHEPLSPGQTTAGPLGHPAPHPAGAGPHDNVQGTPPGQPGPNPPSRATAPGTNFPARPDSPSSNPGGGPNQHGALSGRDGLPGGRAVAPSPSDPGSDTAPGGLAPPVKPRMAPRSSPLTKETQARVLKALSDTLDPVTAQDILVTTGIIDANWYEVEKAGAGSGQFTGDIEALDVGSFPTDPETGEPMDFPVGTGPLDAPSPEELHAMEMAVFVETSLHDMADPWADLVSQIVTMIVYGFALHEIVYKKRNGPNPDEPVMGSRFSDGRIGWAKIAGRAQETRHRWEFDEVGNVLGMWQLAPPKFQLKYIPMAKALLFRTTGYKNNPEGRSLLRSAYRPWYFKRRIEEIEAIGVERDLAGIPLFKVPWEWMSPNATPDQKAALGEVKEIVKNIRIDEQHGIVIPAIYDPETKQPLFEFELVGAGGSSRKNFDTDKIITRYDQRIAMVALADFILIGHDSTGSKALADTKTDLFTSALESLLNTIADVFNTNAIPRLMQMNGEDPAMSPKLTFGKLSRISVTEMAALVTALAAAGADLFPDVLLEDAIREAGGLPAKMSSDDL